MTLYAMPGPGNDSIVGGTSGSDQISYTDYTGSTGAVFNFTAGTIADPYGGTDHFTGIEWARGGAGADTFIGSAANETLRGLAGDDSIDGGGGQDEVRYDLDAQYGGAAGVTVNLITGIATDGFGDTDLLSDIEHVRGTAQADSITTGNADLGGGTNVYQGTGLGGDDTITAGSYTLYAMPGSGDDSIAGGASGFDQISYSDYTGTAGAVFDFVAGTVADPYGGTDHFTSMEAGRGGAGADTFLGSGNDEFFRGLAGDDSIAGGSGSDEVRYDLDAQYGGTGAVTVNLATGTATDGFGDHDTLANIQAVRGTAQNDTLIGGAADETFQGGPGNDSIDGGAGSDTAVFSAPSVAYAITASAGTLTVSGPDGTDTLTRIEWLQFSDTTLASLPSYAITATDADKDEGNSGTTPFVFTVNRSGGLLADTIGWTVVGAATNSANPADFAGGVAPSGTLSFAAGVVSQVITVNVAGDTVVEPDEGFRVILARPASGGGVASAIANGTIINDDIPPTTLAIAATSASKAEGNSGSTPFTFTVTRSGVLTGASSVHWQVIGGASPSANAADFTGGVPSGTLSFAAGVGSQTITVNVAGDTTVEPDEHFQVMLGGAVGASISTASASATIVNDDTSLPSLAIAATSASKAEGNSGSTPFTFTVTRSGGLTGASSVHWQVIGGASPSANAADFVGGVPSGTLSFAAGVVSQVITVNVAGDTTVEPDEHFQVVLGGAAGASIGTASASATIVNDDTTLAIAATDASKAEGNSGTTPFIFTITRSGNLSGVSTVNCVVSGGASPSANSADFPGAVSPGLLTFAAGVATRIITIDVAGDTTLEPDEHFQVVLSTPSGATITTASASATIVNDDTALPILAIAATSASKAEGNSGSTPFTFTVTRSGSLSGASSVNWQVIGGSSPSANTADFTGGAPLGALSFAAGVVSQTITVNVAGDTTVEADEHFQVVLGGAVGASIGTASATGTIVNDDGTLGADTRPAPAGPDAGELYLLAGAPGPAAAPGFIAPGSVPAGDSGGAAGPAADWATLVPPQLVTGFGAGQHGAGLGDDTGDGHPDMAPCCDPHQHGAAGGWTLLTAHDATTQYAAAPQGW